MVERISWLRDILGDEAKVMALIREELLEIRDRYGDERRTEITHSEDEIDIEDLIADQQMVIAIRTRATSRPSRSPPTASRSAAASA